MILGIISSWPITDGVLRWSLVLAKLNQAFFLLVDHYVWFIKIDVLDADPKRFVRLSAIFWLAAIVCNLVRDVHDIAQIIQREKEKQRSSIYKKTDGVENDVVRYVEPPPFSLTQCLSENKPLAIDIVKNLTDMFLPLSALQFIKPSEAYLAVMGMISSYMGVLSTWNSAYKLKPS